MNKKKMQDAYIGHFVSHWIPYIILSQVIVSLNTVIGNQQIQWPNTTTVHVLICVRSILCTDITTCSILCGDGCNNDI